MSRQCLSECRYLSQIRMGLPRVAEDVCKALVRGALVLLACVALTLGLLFQTFSTVLISLHYHAQEMAASPNIAQRSPDHLPMRHDAETQVSPLDKLNLPPPQILRDPRLRFLRTARPPPTPPVSQFCSRRANPDDEFISLDDQSDELAAASYVESSSEDDQPVRQLPHRLPSRATSRAPSYRRFPRRSPRVHDNSRPHQQIRTASSIISVPTTSVEVRGRAASTKRRLR